MDDAFEAKAAAMRARMAEMASKFIERSRGELGRMRAALKRLAAGDASALGEIRHFAHRMAGTGATLGFEKLGDCATRVEKLAGAQAAGSVPGEVALAQLTSAVESLAAQFDVEAPAGR